MVSNLPQVRVSLAMSLDGYIADANGSVDWLNPYFHGLESDWHQFMNSIGATVMGRITFEEAISKYGSSAERDTTYVLTHGLVDASTGAVGFEDIEQTTQMLRERLTATGKDIWLMGGGLAVQAFADAKCIDVFELSVVPILLGSGKPLFPGGKFFEQRLDLIHEKRHPNGVVGLTYAVVRG